MSAAHHLRLVAVDGALMAPVARKGKRRATAIERVRHAINDAGGISRTCDGLREIAQAFVIAAGSGNAALARALAREMEIEAGYAARMSENLARRLADLTAGGEA